MMALHIGEESTSDIERRYREVLHRIEAACGRSGRDPAQVKVVVVSKTQPLERVREAVGAGIRDFGENRSRELVEKADRLERNITWHFIGHMQTNKVRQVVGRASLIHSVDSERLAVAIAEEAAGRGIRQKVLLQVNVAEEESKSGLGVKDLPQALLNIMSMRSICVKGLMTIAPLTGDEDKIRRVFCGLRELRDETARLSPETDLELLSMGMTNDYEIAVEEGANLLRLGTAVFGPRDR
jgi:pyridoxal phosphate enzyme (YggS family)